MQLKLNVDQISTAIRLLDEDEKRELKTRLSVLLGLKPDELESVNWLHLAESAFSFWEDEKEDIYNDLIPTIKPEN